MTLFAVAVAAPAALEGGGPTAASSLPPPPQPETTSAASAPIRDSARRGQRSKQRVELIDGVSSEVHSEPDLRRRVPFPDCRQVACPTCRRSVHFVTLSGACPRSSGPGLSH